MSVFNMKSVDEAVPSTISVAGDIIVLTGSEAIVVSMTGSEAIVVSMTGVVIPVLIAGVVAEAVKYK
jgi:hypothetical protein